MNAWWINHGDRLMAVLVSSVTLFLHSQDACRQRARAGPLPQRATVRAALERGGADERGRLRVDQLLTPFYRGPDAVSDIGEFQFVKQVKQVRLAKSHRVLSLSMKNFERFSLTITRWLTTSPTRRSATESYTAQRDVTTGRHREDHRHPLATRGQSKSGRRLCEWGHPLPGHSGPSTLAGRRGASVVYNVPPAEGWLSPA
jgi:hypothetical protein